MLTKATEQQKTILAVDPNTRDLGIAIFTRGRLSYFAMKTIKPRRPRRALLETAANVIENLIAGYKPTILAIERISFIQQSEALLSVVTEEIRITAESRGLDIKEYDPVQVRKEICQSNKASKRETFDKLCQLYPELNQFMERQSAVKARYYGHLFAAVAVGRVCAYEVGGPDPADIPFEDRLIF